MGGFRALWRSLMEPSRFDGEPLLGLYNQWGHYALGAAVYILSCAAWFFAMGEMPPRWIAACVLIAAYLGLVEIRGQGWRGRDTLDDTGFFAMGVLTIASSVREVAASGWYSEIVVHVGYLAAAVFAASWACLIYAAARWKG